MGATVDAKALKRKLDAMTGKEQAKVVRQALNNSADRVKQRIIRNVTGILQLHTGNYLRAWLAADKVTARRRKTGYRGGIGPPERSLLGIDERDPNYWPYAIEYGHIVGKRGLHTRGIKSKVKREIVRSGAKQVPAKPHIRPAVDENKRSEQNRIGREIGKNLERLAKRTR
jgi:hypothetical protein